MNKCKATASKHSVIAPVWRNPIYISQYIRCSFWQVKPTQRESVETTNVINFECVETVCSHEELFKRHLPLAIMLQWTGNNRQQVLPQAPVSNSNQTSLVKQTKHYHDHFMCSQYIIHYAYIKQHTVQLQRDIISKLNIFDIPSKPNQKQKKLQHRAVNPTHIIISFKKSFYEWHTIEFAFNNQYFHVTPQ